MLENKFVLGHKDYMEQQESGPRNGWGLRKTVNGFGQYRGQVKNLLQQLLNDIQHKIELNTHCVKKKVSLAC